MGLFRFPHYWSSLAGRAPALAPVVAELDDRDRALEDHLAEQFLARATLISPSNPDIQYLWQVGSSVVDTDASGNATIALPVTFAGGIVAVLPTNGDGSPVGGIVNSHSKTTSQFGISVLRHDGTAYDGLFRCDWLAVGW